MLNTAQAIQWGAYAMAAYLVVKGGKKTNVEKTDAPVVGGSGSANLDAKDYIDGLTGGGLPSNPADMGSFMNDPGRASIMPVWPLLPNAQAEVELAKVKPVSEPESIVGPTAPEWGNGD